MQLQCADSLVTVLSAGGGSGGLDTATVDKLGTNVLELLLYTDARHVRAYLRVFEAGVAQMSQEALEGEVIPQLAKMQHFKQPWLRRKTGAKMLRHCFAEMREGALKFQELPSLLQALAQDADWHMRKKMSRHLDAVCAALPPHLGEKHAVAELLELLRDMEIQVQLEALLSLCRHLKLISVEQVEEDILPVLAELMACEDPDILTGLARHAGPLLYQVFVAARRLLPRARPLFARFYVERMLRAEGEGAGLMLELAAFHLPCFASLFAPADRPPLPPPGGDNTPAP